MVNMFPVHGKQKAVNICRAFAEGAPKGANCSVFYGVNASNHTEWQRAKLKGDWYYIDNSYFDKVRGDQFRVTKNNIQCDPFKQASDGKRFEALGLTIAPWKPFNSKWLVVEQSPSFMQFVAHDRFWLEREMQYIPAGVITKVRPWAPNKTAQAASLHADLAEFTHIVTHSSAAAVEATMLGVQANVSNMSALAAMICSTDEKFDQRRAYLNVLADNQWTLDEIKAGKAWAHLNRS